MPSKRQRRREEKYRRHNRDKIRAATRTQSDSPLEERKSIIQKGRGIARNLRDIFYRSEQSSSVEQTLQPVHEQSDPSTEFEIRVFEGRRQVDEHTQFGKNVLDPIPLKVGDVPVFIDEVISDEHREFINYLATLDEDISRSNDFGQLSFDEITSAVKEGYPRTMQRVFSSRLSAKERC